MLGDLVAVFAPRFNFFQMAVKILEVVVHLLEVAAPGFLAFGWETAIPFLPGWIKSLTVRYHLAALVPADALPAGMRAGMNPPDVASGLLWLVGGSAVMLAVSVWLFARRDYP